MGMFGWCRGPGRVSTTALTAWQASVGFGTALRLAGAVEQVQQLHKLAEAMDKVKHLDVEGIHIMIGTAPGQQVDALGNLWLDASDGALSWAGWLLILSSPPLLLPLHLRAWIFVRGPGGRMCR